MTVETRRPGAGASPAKLLSSVQACVARAWDDGLYPGRRAVPRRWLAITIAVTTSALVVVTGCAAPSTLGERPTPAHSSSSGASTAAPTPRPTAGSSLAPVQPPTFSAFNLSGSEDRAPKFAIPQNIPALATIRNRGTGPFVVWTLAADGSKLHELVNMRGNYDGTVIFDAAVGEFAVAFDVSSHGAWRITVKPLEQAATWSGTSKLLGSGDDVRVLATPSSGLRTVAITNAGTGPFLVRDFSLSGGSDLLVNAVGKYSGQHVLPDGTIVLEVNSDGAWSIRPLQ